MTYAEAVLKLLIHANIVPDSHMTRLPEHQSFLHDLYISGCEQKLANLNLPFEDIIDCLEVVNRELNGAIPSETIAEKKRDIPRDLVYAMSNIIADGLLIYQRWAENDVFDLDTRKQLFKMISHINDAWTQVLAGDVDNLREEIGWSLLSKE